jgi:hypothetical protein
MVRHRRSLQPTRNWGLARVRLAALLTLAVGSAGGLFLADQQKKHDAASASEAQQAQAALAANVTAWSGQNNQDRALEAAAVAAEKKRQEEAAAAEAARKKAEEQASRGSRPSTPSVPFGPIPESCNAYTGNRAIGCALVLAAGLEMQQMVCLERLWTKESGWNEHSYNRGSGAYGIPQALPGDKMGAFGSDWRDNPATQIRWGLSYIKGRYGDPCGAWSSFQSHNWY